MSRRGFTLVEVLVAVVVLEVGLLGVVGTLVLAARVLARAGELERAVTAMEAVYDSLRQSGGTGSGEVPVAGGVLSWEASATGALRVEHRRGDGTVVAVHGAADGLR